MQHPWEEGAVDGQMLDISYRKEYRVQRQGGGGDVIEITDSD